MSSSSSWEDVRQRRMKGYNLIHNSTPVEETYKPCIISASSIDTNSSSSMILRRRIIHSVKVEKKLEPAKTAKDKKPVEAKKDKKPVKAKKEKKPVKAKKEKKLVVKKTKARINRKATKPKKFVNSDDWLTTEEQIDDEKENLEKSVKSPAKGPALFEDTASPELVRDTQAFHEYHFDLPIRQRRKDVSSLVRVDLGDAEKSLPVTDLPHFRTLFDSSDEEEELLLKRNDTVRTYPGGRGKLKKKDKIRVDKCDRWLIDVKCPTTRADMLWDAYVKEHPEEMREYIAPPGEPQKKLSSSSSSGHKDKAAKKEDWRTKKISIGPDDPKHRYIVRRRYNMITKEWESHYITKDPYKFPESNDNERPLGASYLRWFSLSSSKNKRIAKRIVKRRTIKEKGKLERSKSVESVSSKDSQDYNDLYSSPIRKNIVKDPYEIPGSKDAEIQIGSAGDSDLHQAGPSCSKNERTTNRDVKNTKIKEKRKLERSKPVESASYNDSQDYNDLCSSPIRKNIVKDPYEIPGSKDAETQIGSAGDSDLNQAGPSCSKNERTTNRNVKNTKIKEKRKLERSKPVVSASYNDSQDYNDLCSYAIRKNIVKDPYEIPGSKDAQTQIGSVGDSDLHQAGPSCSKNERTTNRNVKNTKIKEKRKLERSKPVESASYNDSQDYNDFCSYAIRKNIVKDPYEIPGSKDAETQIGSAGDSDSNQAGPSCSKNERTTNRNVKNTKIKEKRKLERSKPVESASYNDSQDYNDLCSYAIRKNIVKDPYEIPGSKDAQTQIGSVGDSDLHQAGPSCSKNERTTKRNVESIKVEGKGKSQRSKPVQRVSSKEFQRYSDVCAFAARLKAKEQELLSENVSKSSNEKSLISAKKFFKRKIMSDSNKDDSKRAKIRSVRDLDGTRYIKENDHWRIV